MPHIVCLMRLRGGTLQGVLYLLCQASHSVPYATQRRFALLNPVIQILWASHSVPYATQRRSFSWESVSASRAASHSVPYATQRRSIDFFIALGVNLPHIVCLMRLRGGPKWKGLPWWSSPHIVCLMRLRGGSVLAFPDDAGTPHIVCLMRLRGGPKHQQ